MSKVRALKVGLAVAALLFTAGSVKAEEPTGMCQAYCGKLPSLAYRSVDDIPVAAIEIFQRGDFIENILSQGLSVVRNAGGDRRRLTREYVENARLREERESKRQTLSAIVMYDQNFDGYVTADEIEAFFSVDLRAQDDQRMIRKRDEIMSADTDGDGRVSLREAVEGQDKKRAYASHRIQGKNRMEQLLALDMDGDGALSDKEMEAIIYAGFAVLDRDGDGQLSEQEKQPLRERAQREIERVELENRLSKCKAPKPVAEDDIVFLGAHKGSSYSSASFVAQRELTYAAEVSVSHLDQKAYLVLASLEPMIWDITGTTSRLSQILIFGPRDMSGDVLSGVRGFDKNRVSFLAVEDCLPGLNLEIRDEKSDEMKQMSAALGLFLGRAPTVVQGISRVYEAALLRGGFVVVQSPAPGKLEKPKDGFDPEIWAERIAGAKTDLRFIAAEDVFSPAKVMNSSILPASYGLAKLIYEGVIEKVPTGAFMRVFTTGRGGSVTVYGGGGDDKFIGDEATQMRRVPIYEYRLRRDVPSLPAVLMGIDKLLVPEGVNLPEATGMQLCEGQKGPVGERVYAPHCRR